MDLIQNIFNSEFFTGDAMPLLTQILIGAAISGFTQLAKKFNMSSKVALALLSVILGAVIVGFENFVPEEIQEKVLQFVLQVGAFAVAFYDFVLKRFAKKDAGNQSLPPNVQSLGRNQT